MAFIPDYIARMHGEAEVEYRHPALEPIFKDTYGIPVYQEQLMRAAVELAGYTPSESDELRKAISKKKKEDIEKHRKKFVAWRGQSRGWQRILPKPFTATGKNSHVMASTRVMPLIMASSLLKPHILKSHYHAEYMAALLSANAGKTEKVAWYVAEARSMGVPVLPPEINASGWDFAIEDA